eukprot:6480633-Amphidinium_carterae.1
MAATSHPAMASFCSCNRHDNTCNAYKCLKQETNNETLQESNPIMAISDNTFQKPERTCRFIT